MRKTILLVLPAVACAAALGVSLGGGLATASSSTGTDQSRTQTQAASGKIDPRAGGFEIGLGEWALLPEAPAIRPGRVTFVIRNSGKFKHGFEMEIRRVDGREDDEDDAETDKLLPGQVARLTMNVTPGLYEIECNVSNHDDLGMRGVLEVREDAPFIAPPRSNASGSKVDIVGFAFKPATVKATAGQAVSWRNLDPAPHTATGKQFSSPQLGKGGSFKRRFTQAGTYPYLCALHPGMRGKVVVASKGPR